MMYEVFVVVWNYRYQNSNVTILLMWHVDSQTFDELVWIRFFLDFEYFRFRFFNHSKQKTQTLIY